MSFYSLLNVGKEDGIARADKWQNDLNSCRVVFKK